MNIIYTMVAMVLVWQGMQPCQVVNSIWIVHAE